MARNDKTMRAFLRGALVYGVTLVLTFYGFFWIFGATAALIPKRTENVLWIAPWLLVGGLFGVGEHFSKERRVQFSTRLLLLITLLFSFSGAWGTLARSRYRGEQKAIANLEEKIGLPSRSLDGPFFPIITEVGFYGETVTSDSIPFLISQLKYFPGLYEVNFFGKESVSVDDLATLRAAFPDVVFVQE